MAFPEPLHEDLLTMDQHFWSLMNELANESNSAVSFAQSNKLVLAATVKAPEDASMSPQSSSPPSSPTSQASPSAGYATSPSQHRNTSFAFDGPRISSPASATLPLPMPVTAQTHSEPADLGRITHAKSGGKRRRKQAKAKAKVTKQGVKLKPKSKSQGQHCPLRTLLANHQHFTVRSGARTMFGLSRHQTTRRTKQSRQHRQIPHLQLLPQKPSIPNHRILRD
eukprot:TRINITY_DN12494_c0_g1_i1.p3 TRINITY_DN12494_c0_g1~~TRINITY_DN12494_c0_g1_i1.p3  ORF type:complete len:224 (+),score=18.59 TRINITY_DN12494_c0_g1_i1:277-948(+)